MFLANRHPSTNPEYVRSAGGEWPRDRSASCRLCTLDLLCKLTDEQCRGLDVYAMRVEDGGMDGYEQDKWT